MPTEQFYKEQLHAKDQMMAMTTTFLMNIQQELESKNNDLLLAREHIHSSLRMAGLLQMALLPDTGVVGSYLKNCVFRVLPQATIGGDFVFIMKRSDDILFGLFDCTGHGIPAAILATSAYFILKEFAYRDKTPGTILSRMNKAIYNTFRNDYQNIAQLEGTLCAYDKANNTVTYAAAQGRGLLLWENDLVSLAKNKVGIAQEHATVFEDHHFSVSSPARIFLYSDGLVDQFGGPRDKKLTRKRLHGILSSGSQLSVGELDASLEREFLLWKDDTPQTDDMSYLVIDL